VGDALAQHGALDDRAAVGCGFGVEDLEASDLAAEDIEDEVQIQELPPDRGWEWSKKQGVVELSPCFSSTNRTCTSQRMRLSIQAWPKAMATSW
jgi:hypothetical protein